MGREGGRLVERSESVGDVHGWWWLMVGGLRVVLLGMGIGIGFLIWIDGI